MKFCWFKSIFFCYISFFVVVVLKRIIFLSKCGFRFDKWQTNTKRMLLLLLTSFRDIHYIYKYTHMLLHIEIWLHFSGVRTNVKNNWKFCSVFLSFHSPTRLFFFSETDEKLNWTKLISHLLSKFTALFYIFLGNISE